MIHVVTYGNFELLDSRIEAAYRRRIRSCDCCRAEEEAVPRTGREMARRIERSRNWLRKLENDLEALARSTEGASARRRRSSRTVVVNAKMPGAGRARKSRS